MHGHMDVKPDSLLHIVIYTVHCITYLPEDVQQYAPYI